MLARFAAFVRPNRTAAGADNANYYGYDSSDDTDDEEEADAATVPADNNDDAAAKAFFARGRDYESTDVNHRYTAKEQKVLNSYESLDYLPPDSKAHRRWLRDQPAAATEWDRWLLMGIIGVVVGLLGFLLHQTIDVIAATKWSYARTFIGGNGAFVAWLWLLGYGLVFVVPSTVIVVLMRPSAAGSGMPELIGFLNGALIRHIFNVKTLAAKFFSCAFAVGGGLPVGPEGPMIHMGALVGAGVSQLQSQTLGISLPWFRRFRNSQDRRNFISAGAAAGVASAFGAPVGGLLFAMEEVSSFWSNRLSWQTFFCCMVSAFTTDLLDSAFHGFAYQGAFGLFETDRYILFNVENGIDMNVLAILPSAVLGVIGGLLGAAFTFCNLKLAKLRRRCLARLKSEHAANVAKMAEPLLILLVVSTAAVFLPMAFSCTPLACTIDAASDDSVCVGSDGVSVDSLVEAHVCTLGRYPLGASSEYRNGSFSQAGTLFFATGEEAIHHLFSRNTHLQLDYAPLALMLVFYFAVACWAAGTHISSGLVVPMLLIGGLYGRMLGKVLVDLFGVPTAEYWHWIDPGAMAMIGAVSFFGGVTRLTLSLTVIMVEMTNDIQFLLLIMTAVMVAKWVGDYFTHPIYHALLELNCIPFLEQEPVVLAADGRRRLNLELFQARHVMRRPVVTLSQVETAATAAKRLLSNRHSGFPVVNERGCFQGTITRVELTMLLMRFCEDDGNRDAVYVPNVPYADVLAQTNRQRSGCQPGVREKLEALADGGDSNDGRKIDLEDYVNTSAVSVATRFSLQRTYLLFRTLGLRRMVVLDEGGAVEGILTRKDLMGFVLEDKLLPIPQEMSETSAASQS